MSLQFESMKWDEPALNKNAVKMGSVMGKMITHHWFPPPRPWSSPAAPQVRSGWHPRKPSSCLASAWSLTPRCSSGGTGHGPAGPSWDLGRAWGCGASWRPCPGQGRRAACTQASGCWGMQESPLAWPACRRSGRRCGCSGASHGMGPSSGCGAVWKESVSQPWLLCLGGRGVLL